MILTRFDKNFNSDPLIFRFFKMSDTADSAQFVSKEWPVASILTNKTKTVLFMHSYLELCRLSSSYMEVACISNKVVGLLFGKIETDCTLKVKIESIFYSIIVLIKIISGKYGKLSKPLLFVKNLISTEIKYQQSSPKSDGEIVLFMVNSEYRGQGIGKTLMDRFVAVAKDKRVKRISLYTDTFCNWQFYEKYGFTRYSTFKNDLRSFLRGENVKGFIYILDINNTPDSFDTE